MQLSIKKVKIRTAEELQKFNSGEIEIAKDLVYLGFSYQFKLRLQPRAQKKTDIWKDSSERTRKDHQV